MRAARHRKVTCKLIAASSVDKASAIGKIAENWYRRDSLAAESWVKQLLAGSLYDAGAQGICSALDIVCRTSYSIPQ